MADKQADRRIADAVIVSRAGSVLRVTEYRLTEPARRDLEVSPKEKGGDGSAQK